MVYGGFRHDRGCDLGRDFHLGAGLGRRRFLLLHADGRRFHRRAAGRRVPAHPDLLPPPGGVALRIPRRALRHPLAPYRGMVLLRVEDAGCRAACLRGLRRHATAGFQPLRATVLAQCAGDDALRLALYAARGCQVAHLDGYAQDFLPGGQPRAVDRLHHAGARHVVRRNDPRGCRVALFAGVFLRRSLLRPLFLEDVPCGRRAADLHDGARPGHDAAEPELRHAARFAEKHRPDGRQPDIRHLPVPRAGCAALHLHRPHRPCDARKGRPGILAGGCRGWIAGICWHTVCYRAYFEYLFSCRFGPYGPYDFVHGRHPARHQALR